jgi:hypothetical protein
MKEGTYEKKMAQLPKDAQRAMRDAMEKYGNDHWWLSDEPKIIAQNQIFEDCLLVPFALFHKGIEELLGRPVWRSEFDTNKKGLREESTKVITGLPLEDRNVRIQQGIKSITKRIAGRKIILAVTTEVKKDENAEV